MKRIIAACCALLTISVGAGTFDTEDLFTITLPQGWVRMPDDVLIKYAEVMDERAVDEAVQVYDYGFQLSEDEWLSYPCVLVQVNYVGRFSTGDLGRFAQDAGGESASVNADKALFMEVRGQQGIKILIARQLTEYGYIELSGFATDDTFQEYEAVFRDAFSSLQLDDLIRYKPRLTDNAPAVGNINVGKVVVVFIQASFVGALLWLAYGLIRKLAFKRSPTSA